MEIETAYFIQSNMSLNLQILLLGINHVSMMVLKIPRENVIEKDIRTLTSYYLSILQAWEVLSQLK